MTEDEKIAAIQNVLQKRKSFLLEGFRVTREGGECLAVFSTKSFEDNNSPLVYGYFDSEENAVKVQALKLESDIDYAIMYAIAKEACKLINSYNSEKISDNNKLYGFYVDDSEDAIMGVGPIKAGAIPDFNANILVEVAENMFNDALRILPGLIIDLHDEIAKATKK